MPVKLLHPLRFLNSSALPPVARCLSMRLHSSPPPNAAAYAYPILSRAFPFKLKYRFVGDMGTRRFSTRPFRTNAATPGADTRASKSLIDDEAELDHWVSDLTGPSRNEGDSGSAWGRNKSGTGTGNGRGGDVSNRRRDTGFKRSRDGGDFGRGGAGRGSRAKVSNFGTKPGFDRRNDGRGQPGDFKSSPKGSWGNGTSSGRKPRFSSDLDDDEEEEDEGDEDEETLHKGPKKGGALRGVNSGPVNKGGQRPSDRHSWGNEGSRTIGERGSRRGAPFMGSSDGDEAGRGELLTSFKDLVSEDDGDSGDELEMDDPLPQERTNAAPRVSSSGGSESYLSESRFDQCSISPLSLKAIKDAGYEKMTIVQEATLPVILKGKDVLAKARTGTGKTVAFLLPSIEVIVKSPPAGRDQRHPPIVVLVICPTRELASQAAAEAHKLLKYHPSIGVQVVIGGTRLSLEQKRMQTNPCQILVATPGRLKDHIENTAGFATRLNGVNVLVLDEADHLLDMGFRKDIERIVAAVPKQRQTLLFSATVAAEVRQVCHIALKRDHEFINTVQEGSEETHSQVKQMHMVAPLDKQFPLIYSLLKEHISDDVDYKVLVFCTTAMVTRMVADLLGELNLNVREIHSRKPQSYRTRISDEFRKSKGIILVTSDVSARGVDYPDVTLVIQVGVPSDRQQYIHRLGRTGRKGKEGRGILLLAPWEEFFLSTIKDLPITKAPMPLVDPDMRKKVERALSHVEMKNKEAAYQAWLGYYNSNKGVGRDKSRLVELANDFSRSMGLDNPPAIPKLVLGKMGLKNVPGLRSK